MPASRRMTAVRPAHPQHARLTSRGTPRCRMQRGHTTAWPIGTAPQSDRNPSASASGSGSLSQERATHAHPSPAKEGPRTCAHVVQPAPQPHMRDGHRGSRSQRAMPSRDDPGDPSPVHRPFIAGRRLPIHAHATKPPPPRHHHRAPTTARRQPRADNRATTTARRPPRDDHRATTTRLALPAPPRSRHHDPAVRGPPPGARHQGPAHEPAIRGLRSAARHRGPEAGSIRRRSAARPNATLPASRPRPTNVPPRPSDRARWGRPPRAAPAPTARWDPTPLNERR